MNKDDFDTEIMKLGLNDSLTFGKYKGLTIEEVGELDSKYLIYISKFKDFKKEVWAKINKPTIKQKIEDIFNAIFS